MKLLLLTPFLLVALSVGGQTPRVWPTPLQATLDVPLDTSHMVVDAPIFASTRLLWAGPDCTLRPGATLSGRVLAVQSRSKGNSQSSLTLLFDHADCNGQRAVPFALALYALIDTRVTPNEQMFAQGITGTELAKPHITLSGSPGTTTSRSNTISSGASTLAAKPFLMQGASDSAPVSVKAGQVLGLEKVKLSVGTGQQGSSILFSTRQDFFVPPKARLVLVALELPRTAPSTLTARTPPAPPPPPALPPPIAPDTAEICASSTCTLASDSALTTPPGVCHLTSLLRFGYQPRTHSPVEVLDNESTVTFLSPTQVLVTFDPHHLRLREGQVWPPVHHYLVRAVLLNAQTGAIERVTDRSVEGSGRYLWPAGPGEVLVHMADSLQRFGPDLKRTASIPTRGDLLWVAVSPAGHRIAFAQLQERHTHADHDRIALLAHNQPHENAQAFLLDGSGKLLQELPDASSDALPPLLTDSGDQILVQSKRPDQWQLLEQTPESQTPQPPKSLITLNSTCEPAVTLLPSALFVTGCTHIGAWYRLLRPGGSTLIKGEPSLHAFAHSAQQAGTSVYAIRIVDMAGIATPGVPFNAASLTDERVILHRGGDGRQLLVVKPESFPLTTANYALAPDASQLAVLTDRNLVFYPIPQH